MSLYVGIDIGKFFHVACFLDEGRNQIELLKFGNSHQGFSELEKLIKGFSTLGDELILGMEATGHYCFPLYEFLIDKEYQVKVFNPLKVNRFRNFYIQPTKTDPKDALVIANILRILSLNWNTLKIESAFSLKKLKMLFCRLLELFYHNTWNRSNNSSRNYEWNRRYK